jgi:hypothetical protein
VKALKGTALAGVELVAVLAVVFVDVLLDPTPEVSALVGAASTCDEGV